MNTIIVKKHFTLTCLIVMVILATNAQKKVKIVSQSTLSGIVLPNGSKQDGRFLTELSAKTLFEMETKKAGVSVTTVEVLLLPVASGFTSDSLITQLAAGGYSISPLENDNKYAWLQKDNHILIAYFESKKAGIDLYFGELSGTPTITLNTTMNPIPPTPPAEQSTTSDQNTGNQTAPPVQQVIVNNPPPASMNNGYAFTTTNFDDGWTSTVQEDWVEVSKGNLKVLLHYPKEGTIIAADPEPNVNNAWNILVAPRYSNLKNYKVVSPSLDYQRAYMGSGNLTDKNGNEVYVALFRKGGSGWMEFIAPDKNTFIQQFGVNADLVGWDAESGIWNTMLAMENHNKFGVAASDFSGVWTSDFNGMQQLYNVYTGTYAGMYMNQSRESFEFDNGGNYSWKLLVVNGMVGSSKFAQVKSSGQLQVLNNWQVHFSDIEGKPKKYHAFFSCIKGARLLNLLDADAPGSGLYTIYGKK